MASSGMLRRVALGRTDVSEDLRVSFIRVTRIGELGTTLVVSSKRPTLRRNPPKRLFLQEPQGVTSRKTPFSRPLEFRIKEHKCNLAENQLEKSQLNQQAHEEGYKICWKEIAASQSKRIFACRDCKKSTRITGSSSDQ
jgi:hypothetical protein